VPLRPRALLNGVLALALLVLGGCAWDTPQTSLVPRSDLTRAIQGVYGMITWVTLVIGALVLGLITWILFRFRQRPGAPMPRQVRGHAALEIAWTIAPALVLLIIAVPTIQVIFRTQAPASPHALEIDVIGKQWWWEYRYPSLGVVTANELHVPVSDPANPLGDTYEMSEGDHAIMARPAAQRPCRRIDDVSRESKAHTLRARGRCLAHRKRRSGFI
jgi:cytochrome c oxidase subunit 2